MFKLCIVAALVALAAAAPAPAPAPAPGAVVPLAYSAPLVAAPVVTAQSSQVFSQNFHGVTAQLRAAPLLASPVLAQPAPYYAQASPYYAGYTQYAAAAPAYYF